MRPGDGHTTAALAQGTATNVRDSDQGTLNLALNRQPLSSGCLLLFHQRAKARRRILVLGCF